MPNPSFPYIISGTVKDSRNTILISIEILFTNTDKSSNPLVITTDSNGKYFADAANFNTGYDSGDSISYEVFNSFKDEKASGSFIISGTKKSLDIQTEVIASLQKGTTGYPQQSILVNVNSKPYTQDNAFFVENIHDRNYTKVYDLDANSLPVYEGRAKMGSSKADAVWRIRKYVRDANGIVTDELWADSNDYFDNIWNNRTSLGYG